MEPAVLTISPDNALTAGLMLALMYAGALLLVQLAYRSGALAPQKQQKSAGG